MSYVADLTNLTVNATMSPNSTSTGDAQPFSAADYVVFTAMLVASLATGLYHAFAGGGQSTTENYLLADRKMSSIPIALSTVVSFLSAITLLGIPSEIYKHGVQYWLTSFSFIVKLTITALVFIPVYYELRLTSAYEYLQMRYGFVTRIAGTIMFIIQTELYMAIVLYAPALAIQAVTSLPIYATILLSGAVCTIYTTLGGIKGVIWADVFQFFVLIASFVSVVVLGSIRAGGMDYVWQYNGERGHLNFFNFSMDPTVRLTFWGATLGAGFNGLIQWAVSQIAVQRFLTAKSLKEAQRSLWWGIPSSWCMVTLVSLSGLVLFAYYNNDDTGRGEPNYSKTDQILIYFVSQEFGRIPGIQGLFVAALYAGTISTITSGLNSLAAVSLVDIIKPWRNWRARCDGKTVEENARQDRRDTVISKILTVVFGVITLALAFLSTKMGSLVRMANTVMGAMGGPIVGLFSLGMLYERSNARGALTGLAAGAATGIWMSIGSLSSVGSEFWLYRVSFMWYSFISFFITFVLGIVVSEICRLLREEDRNRKVDPKLLATFLRRFYETKSEFGTMTTEEREMALFENGHNATKSPVTSGDEGDSDAIETRNRGEVYRKIDTGY